MAIRPLHDRVIIRRVEENEAKLGKPVHSGQRKGKTAARRSGCCRRGQNARFRPPRVAPRGQSHGDQVLFGKYSGSEVKVDGQDVLIVREDEILGIVE